jgi:hypothetical protein
MISVWHVQKLSTCTIQLTLWGRPAPCPHCATAPRRHSRSAAPSMATAVKAAAVAPTACGAYKAVYTQAGTSEVFNVLALQSVCADTKSVAAGTYAPQTFEVVDDYVVTIQSAYECVTEFYKRNLAMVQYLGQVRGKRMIDDLLSRNVYCCRVVYCRRFATFVYHRRLSYLTHTCTTSRQASPMIRTRLPTWRTRWPAPRRARALLPPPPPLSPWIRRLKN